MSQEKVIPTIEEIRAKFAEVRQTIEGYELCLDGTIDDYPIGRRERGKCRLQVERRRDRQGLPHRANHDEQARPLVCSEEEHLHEQRHRRREPR